MINKLIPEKIKKGAAPNIQVEYFAMGYGRADPIRFLLHLKELPYEYIGHTFETWGKVKGSGQGGEFNGLPRVRVNGKEFGQSLAILRSIGVR